MDGIHPLHNIFHLFNPDIYQDNNQKKIKRSDHKSLFNTHLKQPLVCIYICHILLNKMP